MVISFYAGLLGVMLLALSVQVIRGRYATKEAIGDEAFALRRRIRAHGNFVEYTPMFLLLGALVEYQGMPPWTMHALGSLFLLGRLMHAYSLLKHERYVDGKLTHWPIWRTCGMVSTFTAIGIISVALLLHSIPIVK